MTSHTLPWQSPLQTLSAHFTTIHIIHYPHQVTQFFRRRPCSGMRTNPEISQKHDHGSVLYSVWAVWGWLVVYTINACCFLEWSADSSSRDQSRSSRYRCRLDSDYSSDVLSDSRMLTTDSCPSKHLEASQNHWYTSHHNGKAKHLNSFLHISKDLLTPPRICKNVWIDGLCQGENWQLDKECISPQSPQCSGCARTFQTCFIWGMRTTIPR